MKNYKKFINKKQKNELLKLYYLYTHLKLL